MVIGQLPPQQQDADQRNLLLRSVNLSKKIKETKEIESIPLLESEK